MKIRSAAIGIMVWLSCLLAGCAALSVDDTGKRDFESKCASCHGVSGKGDGPLAIILPEVPGDLTRLSRSNGGVFPGVIVRAIIDGRLQMAAHGSRVMPVWGEDFLHRETGNPRDVSAEASTSRETRVNARIRALVFYLSQLQE